MSAADAPPREGVIEVEVESVAWTLALADVEDVVRQAAGAALEAEAPRGEVVILLTDNERVRDLNGRFRGKNEPTNVLSFPAAPLTTGAPMTGALGDIALAFGVCDGEARAQGKPLAAHLRHLVIHGVLHLLGYDHQDDADAETMEALERRLLAGMGVADPYASQLHEPALQELKLHEPKLDEDVAKAPLNHVR